MERAEALHELRGFIGQLTDGCRKALETLIPELAESEDEDERIRKFLLEYAIEMIAGLESDISLSIYHGIKGHDPDAEAELNQWQKARAYLEKQKDHFRDDTKMVEQMLEWAKEKYEEYDKRIAGFPDDGAYWGQRNAFRQMIDKLNSI